MHASDGVLGPVCACHAARSLQCKCPEECWKSVAGTHMVLMQSKASSVRGHDRHGTFTTQTPSLEFRTKTRTQTHTPTSAFLGLPTQDSNRNPSLASLYHIHVLDFLSPFLSPYLPALRASRSLPPHSCGDYLLLQEATYSSVTSPSPPRNATRDQPPNRDGVHLIGR